MAGVATEAPASSNDHGRGLPHNAEAERSVLGSILLDNFALAGVQSLLDHAEYFFFAPHREIYAAMLALDTRQLPIDLTLLNEELERAGAVEKAGGPGYLVRLVEECPTAVNAEYYAGIVRDHFIQRKLIEATRETLEECYHPGSVVDDLLDKAEQRIFEINEKRATSDVATMQEILKECFKTIDAAQGASKVTGLSTGFADLDDKTCGLQPCELIIVAARPSMGKTSFSMNIAEYVAVEQRKGVMVFSLEVSRNQLVQNLLCSRARVNAHNLRRGQLDKESYQALSLVAGDLMDAPLFIDDSPGLNLLKLRAAARRMKRRHDIQLIVIDYLQLLNGPPSVGRGGDASRQQEISSISRGLKALARELRVPVVALSQLNRETDKREDHKPRLADLRESGALEQDADVVMMLYREEYYFPDRAEVKGQAEVILAKQRNGPVGSVDLVFVKEWTRFENPEFHRGEEVLER